MGRIFISYRYDVSSTLACALYQHLRDLKLDVFLNKPSLERVKADPFTLAQIEAASHLLLVLTPKTLNLCAKPEDYLRTEIETAVRLSRPIILVSTPKFNSVDFRRYLDPAIGERFVDAKTIVIRHDYIDETIPQIRKQAASGDKRDASAVSDQESLVRQYFDTLPRVSFNELNAQRSFELALATGSTEEAMHMYSQAISTYPAFAQAYYNRGAAFLLDGNEAQARADYQKAVELNPALSTKNYTHRTVNYVKERPADEKVFTHPILQTVEVPLRRVTLVKQASDLPAIAAGWINAQGNKWPSDIMASAILQQVHLAYLPFWVVNCQATANWKVKIITYRRYQKNEQTFTGAIGGEVKNRWIPNYTGVATIECGPRDTSAATTPVDLDELQDVEITPVREPLTKLALDMVKTDCVRSVFRPQVAQRFMLQEIAETSFSLMQYTNVNQYVALYPIYFSSYEYIGEKLNFQLDGVTGAMYGEIPSAYKRMR